MEWISCQQEAYGLVPSAVNLNNELIPQGFQVFSKRIFAFEAEGRGERPSYQGEKATSYRNNLKFSRINRLFKLVNVAVIFFMAYILPNSCASNEQIFSMLESEYTATYCLQLEAAYGKDMMSDGGEESIESMFDQVQLEGKKALDVGCGLGGVAFYLAKRYAMKVTGLEINPWLVAEEKKRTPDALKNRVDFLLSTSNHHWPIVQDTYDLVYSKGVFAHLEMKDSVFKECHRLLKESGLFIVTDWLSCDEKKWGEHIGRLVALENLALFPESEAGYIELLEKNGFRILSVRDDSPLYVKFNQKIIERLRDPLQLGEFANCFKDGELEAAIEGYQAIVKALCSGELRVIRFVAQKSTHFRDCR